jgi:hypothetical protein
MPNTPIALGTFCIIFTVLAAPVFASDALITVDSGVFDDTQATVECVKAYGGRVKIVIFPDIIIADMPEDVDARVFAHSEASAIHRGILQPEEFGESRRHFITAWNNVYMGQARMMGLDAAPSPDRRPLVDDVVPFEDKQIFFKPPGAKIYDVSEFMLGTASLAVVLAESDGSIDPETEDWTQTEKDEVTSEIINGLDWYVGKAQWRDLVFYTVFYYDVPTGYEPITRPSSQESLWREQCIAALGYSGTYDMANAVRDDLGTDWATLCFIADSSNDGDNTFPDGRFAYSTLGGPRFIMTYGNDGWGIGNMDAVAAHELGHSFYALDEYQSAGEACTARSGYLNSENQNSCYPGGCGGCASDAFFCIMRSVGISVARVCAYSKGHIGWTDTDDDSIPDIMDTVCETILYEYTPDPCSTTTPAYAGTCWVERLPNLNPRNSRKNAITLAMIENVEFRVDGGMWQNASPADGAWDWDREAFHFTAGPLSGGTHVVEARAHHTYGNYDTTFGVDTLTVDADAGVEREVGVEDVFVSTYPNPFGAAVRVRYVVPGTYRSSVPVSLKVFDVRGREVTALVSGSAGPGEKSAVWDGTYSNGNDAPSGIYFLELVAGRARVIKKVVMTR